METALHITSGDIAGDSLAKSGISGEVFVWHDILYNGPRRPGWPDDDTLDARARFLVESTGGGLSRQYVLETLKAQYAKLKTAARYDMLMHAFQPLRPHKRHPRASTITAADVTVTAVSPPAIHRAPPEKAPAMRPSPAAAK